jgi:DNA mismatch repair ATPase MutS
VPCVAISLFDILDTTELPRRDVTFADEIVLLEKVKNQSPDTSYGQLAEVTGVPKSKIARFIQQTEKL